VSIRGFRVFHKIQLADLDSLTANALADKDVIFVIDPQPIPALNNRP
jgi:hypothetical protein